MKPSTSPEFQPELSINPRTVCYLIVKARQFDVKDIETIPDEGSNASDDLMISVLEESPDDPVEDELLSSMSDLNVDEQVDLVALAWLGRDGDKADEWPDIRAEAARSHNENTPSYLLGMPLLADYLEEGLSQLGFSCEDFEKGHL